MSFTEKVKAFKLRIFPFLTIMLKLERKLVILLDNEIITFFHKPYLPTPPLGQDMTQGQFFKRSLTGLNSEFSFCLTSCLTKAEEPSLSYYLPIAGWRIIGFIPFPRVLVLCEMQSVWSRIWTRLAVSISSDDNHYTTGTFCKFIDICAFPKYVISWYYCYYKWREGVSQKNYSLLKIFLLLSIRLSSP